MLIMDRGKSRGSRMSMFRKGVSSRNSFISMTSDGKVKVLNKTEEDFMHAAEVGDLATVKSLVQTHPELNVDTKDVLGRTALRLAVKNEHLEIVEFLLDHSNIMQIYESILQAINTGHVQIAETILKHRRFIEFTKNRRKVGATDNFYGFDSDDSQFSADLTPLILAAHKNLFEIVQILLLRGEKIAYPHKYNCNCRECGNKAKIDPLRVAITRLNAFRGLASESYISLSSSDPILTAFQLAAELRKLAHVEKYFMKEYNNLADQLSEYVVKLLDRVRCHEELELILNKTHKPTSVTYKRLARFKLAIRFNEKKFIAHPSCQQRLVDIWYSQTRRLERSSVGFRIIAIILFVFAYPFLALTYIIAPSTKVGHILTYPCIKFLSHAIFYVMFLGLVLGYAFEMQFVATFDNKLSTRYPMEHRQYLALRKALGAEFFSDDFTVRQTFPTITQLIMIGWIVGFVIQECQHAYRVGFRAFRRSIYNVLDFSYLTGYITAFVLIGMNIYKVYQGLYFLRNVVPQKASYEETEVNLYWMNADRFYWNAWDPINVAEGLFSFSNVIAFSRLSYVLAANEALGPMHISLARMVKDVFRFLVVFTLVFCAFLMGINNLYWYYSVRYNVELVNRFNSTKAEIYFGSFLKTFRTMFWSIYGRGESTAVKIEPFDNHLTEDLGYLLYGVYNVSCFTVLMNMLIAMMARSFELIAEDADVEWKFARSILYLEFIEQGAVLPVPLNLLKVPKALCYELYKMLVKACQSDVSEDMAIPDLESNRPGLDIANGMKDNEAFEQDRDKRSERESPTSLPPTSPMSQSTSLALEGESKKSTLTYEKVMQRIIKRYIFELQREEEVTEDDFQEIKQEISSFRYEILNVLQGGGLGGTGQLSELRDEMTSLKNDFELVMPSSESRALRKKSRRYENMQRSASLEHSGSVRRSSVDSGDEFNEMDVFLEETKPTE